ncbi:hypothetical protein [Yersinia ruckeri]|uniref:hypothetical protein n=1 Tax=Yersinia ruckeri TaxID=29486 RepID=UPI00223789EA|nr:hypothetical protein [Yersinia ruckeri]MCW6567693.1 hypothetical protein [Yersinia ruckeri]
MEQLWKKKKKVHFGNDVLFKNQSVSTEVSGRQTALKAPISALDDDDTDYVLFDEFERDRLKRLELQVSKTSCKSDAISTRRQSERSTVSVERPIPSHYDVPKNQTIPNHYDIPKNQTISTEHSIPTPLSEVV